jgi:hypothetical protein
MKTKIGISAGLLGAAAYFLGLVGGWIPVVMIAGYVLLAETNEWLRMSVVKAVGVCVFFAVVSAIIGLIPNTITFVNNIFIIFDGNFSIAVISRIVTLINSGLTIIEKLLLLALGFKALNQRTVGFGVIDRLITKHTLKDNS